MRTWMHVTVAAAAAAAIACSSGHNDRRSGIDPNHATESGNPQRAAQLTQTSVTGCLQAGDTAGTYTLRVTNNTPDRGGTGGTLGVAASGGANGSPRSTSTTGVGGDVIANSPTIGSGAVPRSYRVIPVNANAVDLGSHVGKQVAIVGTIEDVANSGGAEAASGTATGEGNHGGHGGPITGSVSADAVHTVRATSVTALGDRCSAEGR